MRKYSQMTPSIKKLDIEEIADKVMLNISNKETRYQLHHGK